MTEHEIANLVMLYVQSMDSLIAAVLDDLGESPEALRGAQVVTATACTIISTLVDPTSDVRPETEMGAVATTIGFLVRLLDDRLREVTP